MVLGLVDYGSGSSDEDSNPATATAPAPTPTPTPAAVSKAESQPSSASSSTVEAKPTRKRKLNKGPSLAEKRRMLMAAPVIEDDSDSDDDDKTVTQAEVTVEAPEPESVLSHMLSAPKFQRGRSASSAPQLETVSAAVELEKTAANPNVPSQVKKKRSLIPYALAKKQKEKAAAEASVASSDESEDDNTASTPSVAAAFSYGGINSAPGTSVGPSTAPKYGYGSAGVAVPSMSFNSAPSMVVNAAPSPYPEASTNAPKASFGYGKAPVLQSAVPAGPAVADNTQAAYTYEEGYQPEAIDVHSEDFQQLLGAKERNLSRHGKRGEEINFVDVSQSNNVGSFEEWQLKYGHVQDQMKPGGRQSHKTGSTDKRKHQLTWLATQARERESELQLKWASGTQARRAAKMRYGFG